MESRVSDEVIIPKRVSSLIRKDVCLDSRDNRQPSQEDRKKVSSPPAGLEPVPLKLTFSRSMYPSI
jgi:hypothetical protein